MNFIELDIEIVLSKLNKLNANKKPLWGNMNAQMMIEHLTDLFNMSIGIGKYNLIIEEKNIPKMLQFLDSDNEMPKNFEVPFAINNNKLRNDELELALDEFVEAFISFEEYFENNINKTTLHPYYGFLNYNQWKKLHSKHITHHLKQFGLL